MNMRERELVKVVHTFSVDNGFVADKYAIQTAYRKHPMQNSIRCVSDVLDEIGVDHEAGQPHQILAPLSSSRR